jgi:hypothetical protein
MQKKLPLLVLFLTLPAAYASILQPTATLPPTAGNYSVAGTICFPAACLQNIAIGNFQIVTSVISSGDQLTSSTADLTALGFTNSGGSPGTPLGSVLLSGPIVITYFGRNSPAATGTFNAQITFLDLTGVFAGHTIEAMLNPLNTTVGVTSVTPLSGEQFRIDSFFDVFAQLSIDGGPFVPGPVRHADLVPEPATFIPGLLGIAGCAAYWKRRSS